jgi:hypothetical protein
MSTIYPSAAQDIQSDQNYLILIFLLYNKHGSGVWQELPVLVVQYNFPRLFLMRTQGYNPSKGYIAS